MEQQQPVRRRYISKQRPRPSEFVPVCQPLAAHQLVPVSPPLAAEPYQPKRKRAKRAHGQAGTRVQLAGQRLGCSRSLCGGIEGKVAAGEGESRNLDRKAVGTCCATSC